MPTPFDYVRNWVQSVGPVATSVMGVQGTNGPQMAGNGAPGADAWGNRGNWIRL
jgi:hypothetical protein